MKNVKEKIKNILKIWNIKYYYTINKWSFI